MKKIFIAFVAFLYIFTIPVFASEEDILKEPVKEVEEIKDDENILKGIGNINNTRSQVTDPLYCNSLIVFLNYNGNWASQYVDISNIEVGEKYIIKVNENAPDNIGYFKYIKGAICSPEIGYFERGQEVNDTIITWKIGDLSYQGRYTMNDVFRNTDGFSYEILQNINPEPTQTPEPTPEPEEPEVDPETISGNEILREILRTNREINENVQGIYKYLSNNSVSDSVLSDNSVSDNLIYKRLEDYSTSESLALIGLVLAFGALVIYLIHKTVFKIRR